MATGTAAQLSRVWKRRASSLIPTLMAEDKRTMAKAKQKAVEFSSATAYNPAIDKSRPYARRAPHPPLPPFMVNVQTGTLRAGWKTDTRLEGQNVVSELSNDAPEARFFGGAPTKRMIGRPILQEVVKEMRAPRQQALQNAQRQVYAKPSGGGGGTAAASGGLSFGTVGLLAAGAVVSGAVEGAKESSDDE